MRSLYPDWRARGLTVCLHEHVGGFAFNRESMLGLAGKARAAGASVVEGVEVLDFAFDGSGAVTRVVTSAGEIALRAGGVAVGPWIPALWEKLGLRRRHLDLLVPPGGRGRVRPGHVRDRRRLRVAGAARRQRRGAARRDLRHLGHLRQARPHDGAGRRGAAAGRPADRSSSPTRTGPSTRASRTCGARRSRTASGASRARASATARSAPAGRAPSAPTTSRSSTSWRPTSTWPPTPTTATRCSPSAARSPACSRGEHSTLLHPFRYERFATGDLHPVSHSPYPWS